MNEQESKSKLEQDMKILLRKFEQDFPKSVINTIHVYHVYECDQVMDINDVCIHVGDRE